MVWLENYVKPQKEVCDPGRIRTCNQQSRNLPFYPVELQGPDTEGKNTKILLIIVIFKK